MSDLGLLGIGACLGFAPALIHGFATVSERYLYDVILYRASQDSLATNGLHYQAFHFIRSGAYVVSRAPILLVSGIGLVVACNLPSQPRVFLWLWVGASFGGVALGGNWYPHYFQQLLPPLAVAAALGGRSLAWAARSRRVIVLQGIGLAGTIQILFIVAAVQQPYAPLDRFFVKSDPPNYTSPSIGSAVADYIQAHTSANERIYVAYHRPELYYLAERRPAARWLYIRELGLTPGAFAEQVARIADPQTAPTYIIAVQPFDVYGIDEQGEFRAVVARDYTLETTIGGLPLYRRVAQP